MSLIRVTVCGRAATEPTMRDVNGSSCASFGVIADTGTKDEKGDWESLFLWVTVWGKKGESVTKHLKKGERVLVMGNYSQRLYKDKDGEIKIQNRVTAQDIEFLGGSQTQPKAATPASVTSTESLDSDDDLPF